MTLATADDVRNILQTDETGLPDDAIAYALEAATNAIEEEIGRDLEAAERTEILYLRNRTAALVHYWPIDGGEAVTVTEDDEALTVDDDYLVDAEAGIIRRITTTGFARRWGSTGPITIVYTNLPPPHLVDLCAAIATRIYLHGKAAAGAPTELLGLRQLTVSRWSATTTDAISDPGAAFTLTDAERRICRRFVDRL